MKNKFICILLYFLICVSPVLGNAQPNIVLNGLTYAPTEAILLKDDMMYLSITDLAFLTFTKFTPLESGKYTLSLANTTLVASSGSKTIRVNNVDTQLSHAPFMQEDVFYLPLTLLDILNVPYTLNEGTLSIAPLIPYSQNYDNPDTHTLLNTASNLETIPSYLSAFSSHEAIDSIIHASIADKSYLSFVDNQHFPQGNVFFNEQSKRLPYNTIQVVMRKIDTHSPTPTISSLEIFPMSVTTYSSSWEIKIGTDKFTSQSFWATFLPSHSLLQLDLNKSVDTTLMRMVYEYYRNKYNFKDDKFFVPFTQVTSTQTNTLTHDAYTHFEDKETDYTIKVHRIHPSGSIIFLVDVYKK